MCFYLLAPPGGQLLLCRCFFHRRRLRFGPFVWVEADFLHLKTNPAAHLNRVHTVAAGHTGSGASSPVYSPPATTPLQTWPELCPLCPGKGRHGTPGLNSGRRTRAH